MRSSPSSSAYLRPSSTSFGPGLARPWRRCAAFLAALLLAAFFVPATASAVTYTMFYPEFSWAGGGSNWLHDPNWVQAVYLVDDGDMTDISGGPDVWGWGGTAGLLAGKSAYFDQHRWLDGNMYYPNSYDIFVNGNITDLQTIIINNGSDYKDWSFSGGASRPLLKFNGGPSHSRAMIISAFGNKAGVRTVRFDSVTLHGLEEITLRGGKLALTNTTIENSHKLLVTSGAELSWDGASSGSSLPTFSISKGLTLEQDARLTLLNLRPGQWKVPTINKKGTNTHFALSVVGEQTWTDLGFKYIPADSLTLLGGTLRFDSVNTVNTVSIADGATLRADPYRIKPYNLNVDGTLLIDFDNPGYRTPLFIAGSLSGAGEIKLSTHADLGGAKGSIDAWGNRHSSFENFTGSFNLNDATLTVTSPLDLGGAKAITGGGWLALTTPNDPAWGAFSLNTNLQNNGLTPLTLDLNGEPLTLVSENSFGPTVYKRGSGVLTLSGNYSIDDLRVMGGEMRLTNGAELNGRYGLIVYNVIKEETPSVLNVAGKADLLGKLSIEQGGKLLLDTGGKLTVGTAWSHATAQIWDGSLLYRGGLLKSFGQLDLQKAYFGAELSHPGVFVVSEYENLSGRFDNDQQLSSAVTVNGAPVHNASLIYGSGNNDKIILLAPSGYNLLWREAQSASGSAWGDGQPGWRESYAGTTQKNWLNGASHIAVFGGQGVDGYTVNLQGPVEANLLSFIDGNNWLVNTYNPSPLLLKPFATDPASPGYFAALGSDISGVGGIYTGPTLSGPLLVDAADVPVWKTGSGDLKLTGQPTYQIPARGFTPADVVIKSGRLLLDGPNSLNALGGSSAPAALAVDQGGILRLDGVGRLHNRVSGGGGLEFYNGETVIGDANPDFSGPVLLEGGGLVKLGNRQGLGSSPFNAIDLKGGTILTLEYDDPGLYLPRRLDGDGELQVAAGKNAGLLPGSGDYKGSITLNDGSSLTLLGLGPERTITAAGSGKGAANRIEFMANAKLSLVNGGILPVQLTGDPSGRLHLDANRYTLLDNNIRAYWQGTVDVASRGELTLKADSALGANASPEFAVSGGNLVLDGPGVTFQNLKASGGGQVRLTDRTALALSDTTLGAFDFSSIFLDGQEAALNLSGGFDLTKNLRGTGQVRFGGGNFTLSGNNAGFAGEYALNNGAALNVGTAGQIGGMAALRLNGGTLHPTRSLTLVNPLILESGGGILATDVRLSLTLGGGISGGGRLEKFGDGLLTLNGPEHSFTGETLVRVGELRLAESKLSGTSAVFVGGGATLSGSGGVAGRTDVASGGTLSVDGLFSFGGDLDLASGSDLIFNNGGRLDVGGALNWGNLSNLATINLDSFGAYKLAAYGSTNLAGGVVDGADYTLNYNGAAISNGGDYRVVLENYAAGKELALLFMPTGTRLAYWAKDADGLWETDGEANWNTHFNPAAGNAESWASDARAAVFGASGVSPHAVTLRGPVSASGLFFQDSGWSVGGDALTLLDLDPADGADYAVIGAQSGLTIISSRLTGPAGLHKSGAGKLLLTGANDYAGPTKVTAGGLWLGNVHAAGAGGSIEVADGALLRLAYNNGQTALPQTVTGAGTLAVSGVALLDKINSHTGGTRLGGALLLAEAGALGGGPLDFQGGRLMPTSSLSLGNGVELSGSTNEIAVAEGDSLTLNGEISGSGAFWKTGAGDLLLTGNNGYGGGTTLAGGRTIVGSDTALGTGTVNLLSAATLVFGGSQELANPFQLSGSGLFEVAAGQLAGLSGSIGGTGGFVKSGPGTLTLQETNTYTGLTTVLEGELALSNRGVISDQLALQDNTVFRSGLSVVPLSRLSVNGRARYIGDLGGGGRRDFVVPDGAAFDGLTMLEVDGRANLDQSLVHVYPGELAQVGQKASLIQSTGGLDGAPVNALVNGNFSITRSYAIGLSQDADNLYATVQGIGASEESPALLEGFIAGAALLNQGGDALADRGIGEAVNSVRARMAEAGFARSAFGSVSGGWSEYQTGSSVGMSSLSLLTGLAWGGEIRAFRLTAGPFFELGNGSYNTYNSFSRAGNIRGDGDARYAGGGVFARLDGGFDAVKNPAGAGDSYYLEASLRAGELKNEYRNNDLRDPHTGRKGNYEATSPYYGMHAGAGFIKQFDPSLALELYGKYFWTRQDGERLKLDNGDPVHFAAVTSRRMRVGARISGKPYGPLGPLGLYAGLGWEHEFNGVARASSYGYDIKEASLQGDVGLAEIGLNVKPSENMPLFIDLGLQGYVGERRGIIGSLSAKWEF